jgi:hypothetical protein
VLIDAAAFKLIAKKRKFKPQTLEIAKRRILDKEAAADLAHAYGVNLQRIYSIETQIAAAFQAERLPPGWAEATICAPKAMLAEFQRRAAAARKQLTGKRRPR